MRLLDLCCGGGGASVGYHRAGFDEIVGIDIADQPEYPFEFHRADAIEYLLQYGNEFDVIHASPPCQASSTLSTGTNKHLNYVNMIPEMREALSGFSVPTVMENVMGSDLRKDLVLCGEMFELKVIRHRKFEINNIIVPRLDHVKHRGRVKGWRHGEVFEGYYYQVYGDGGGKGSVPEWQDAMGMPWVKKRKTIAEAIPPAFTEYIGAHIIKELNNVQ